MDVPRARRAVRLAAVTGVIALAVLGFAAFEITSHVTSASHPAAGAPPGGASGGPADASTGPVPSEADASTSGPATPGASPGTSATPSPAPTAPSSTPAVTVAGPVQALTVESAAAFGPDGTSDGDNPQLAGDVLSDPSAGWMTDWYESPDLGGLAQGTGLLLDMGSTVTISTVRVDLGQTPGATIELLTGAQPVAGTFQTQAAEEDAGGLVALTPATPAQARYVLLWFTKLPPEGSGRYQAFVHGVTVEGEP